MSDPSPFVTGGPLRPQDSRVYIERDADKEAAQELQKMNYIALIEPHQQGKTSLIGYLMRRFPYARGYCWVYLDLSLPELRQPARWYTILGSKILSQVQQNCASFFGILNPPTNGLTWSEFLETLSKGAAATNTNLVIALDETAAIPSECALDFFSTIRAVYQCRSGQLYYNHLSFIISCAYDPALLIADSAMSNALNSFQRVEIDDFTLSQTVQLVEHMPDLSTEAQKVVAERIYYWVDGHPFLTQWLCASLIKDRLALTPEGVDDAVQKFLRSDIQHWPSIKRKLNTYPDLQQELKRILSGSQSAFQPSLRPEIRALELVGLIKADSQNYCKVRNRLYEQSLGESLKGDLPMNPDPATTAWAIATLSKATDWLFNQVGEVLKERREKRKQEAVAKESSISGPAPSDQPPITETKTLLAALEQQAELSARKMEIEQVGSLMRQLEKHQKKILSYQERLSGYLSEEARLRFENYLAEEQEKVEDKVDKMRQILERLSGQSIHVPALDE
jgi:hypothetical protein